MPVDCLRMTNRTRQNIGSRSRHRRSIASPCICFINATATEKSKTARGKRSNICSWLWTKNTALPSTNTQNSSRKQSQIWLLNICVKLPVTAVLWLSMPSENSFWREKYQLGAPVFGKRGEQKYLGTVLSRAVILLQAR